MRPGDIIRKDDPATGLSRFWEIEGVYLGAVGQESLVCLRPLSETPGVVGQMAYTNTHVPAAFVQGSIFTPSK